MADNVYKVIELVGTSEESWEKAAKAAVERAAKSLRDLSRRRGRRARLGDRKRQSRSLSYEGEGFFQIRRQGLTLTADNDKHGRRSGSSETCTEPYPVDRVRLAKCSGD